MLKRDESLIIPQASKSGYTGITIYICIIFICILHNMNMS